MVTGAARTSKDRPTIARELRERRLLEFAPAAGKPRVDRAAGIIYGVKIVGRSSPNKHEVEGVTGTDYTPEALAEEAKLLEGICVNVDHPPRKDPGADRSARDRFAWLQEVRVADEGSYGDLHFLDPTDPLAVKMFNAAEQKPDAYALSHNAWGQGEVRNGRYVITHISEVRSVDIVADGGTNRSLFEGQERRIRKVKLSTLIESAKLSRGGRKWFTKAMRQLREADPGIADMEADMPEEGGETDWKKCLVDAIGQLTSSGDEEAHKKASKILAMLKPEAAIPEDDEEGGEEGGEEGDIEEAEDDEEEDGPVEEARDSMGYGWDNKKQQRAAQARMGEDGDRTNQHESRRPKKGKKGTRLLTESRARQLCTLAGVETSQANLKALAGMSQTQAIGVLALLKGQPKGKGPQSRSLIQESHQAPENGVPEKIEELGSWLRN